MRIGIRTGRIFAVVPFADKEMAKLISGYRWHKDTKQWSWPLSVKARVISIFPEAKAQIEQEEQRYNQSIKTLIEVKKQNYNNLIIDESIFKRKPMAHQVDMTKKMLLERKFALLCEVGTGKSQPVVNTFDILHREGKVKHCLIICPKTIVDNWQAEIEINSNYHSRIITGTKAERINLMSINVQFHIINYEGILVLKKYEWWNKFDMVVLDESSKIKNLKAERTKIILEKFAKTPFKYILSGTAVTQSPADIYPQFKFLDPGYLSHMSFYDFRNQYCIFGGYENKQVMGYKNLEELKNKIKYHSIQLKKEDCHDLPEKIYMKRILELPAEIEEQYKDIQQNMIMQSSKGDLTANKIITLMLRMHQILSGAYIEDQKINAKLVELEGLVSDNLHNGTQIIIWCEFKKSIELIRNLMIRMNIKYSEIHGEITNRKEQIDNFQAGKTKVLIGQIQTGGMGINLTAASIVIYFENTFSLENRIQSEGRAHRIGQKNKVTYIDLIYKNTLEEVILKAINDKQNISQYLVKSFKPGNYTKGEQYDNHTNNSHSVINPSL